MLKIIHPKYFWRPFLLEKAIITTTTTIKFSNNLTITSISVKKCEFEL
jgi:hypothetical protein